ncbi:MAG: PaaI family thioesterase [Paracoccaceae bacterium]
MQPVMNVNQLSEFLAAEFPQMHGRFEIESVRPCAITVHMNTGQGDLRPGGTISGPSMFALADCAFYLATLAMIGPEALTVTTSCTINFMRKPGPGRITAEARVHKLGKTLSVGDVLIYSDGVEGPVAQASLTYSIPPKKQRP